MRFVSLDNENKIIAHLATMKIILDEQGIDGISYLNLNQMDDGIMEIAYAVAGERGLDKLKRCYMNYMDRESDLKSCKE